MFQGESSTDWSNSVEIIENYLPVPRMASDHVTLNVGGRLFHTTRGTLEFSKAGFFEAFLRRWNPASPNGSDQQSDQDETSTAAGPPRKRLRSESQISPCVLLDSESPGESTVAICSSATATASAHSLTTSIFIDRDPDAFEGVLYFMRCHKIKPSVSIDACKVKELQIEAEFFGYEPLSEACAERLKKLSELQRPAPTVPAYSDTAILGNRGAVNRPRREIKVPPGHVLYVDFASIWGLETLDETRRVNLGFYRRSSERLPEGQRQVRSITILCSGKRTMENPFANRIGVCISPKDKNDKIGLICAPLVAGILWQVHYWIGPPEKIPQLGVGTAPASTPADMESSLFLDDHVNDAAL